MLELAEPLKTKSMTSNKHELPRRGALETRLSMAAAARVPRQEDTLDANVHRFKGQLAAPTIPRPLSHHHFSAHVRTASVALLLFPFVSLLSHIFTNPVSSWARAHPSSP